MAVVHDYVCVLTQTPRSRDEADDILKIAMEDFKGWNGDGRCDLLIPAVR